MTDTSIIRPRAVASARSSRLGTTPRRMPSSTKRCGSLRSVTRPPKLAQLRRDIADGIAQADRGDLGSIRSPGHPGPHPLPPNPGEDLIAAVVRTLLAEADLDEILTGLEQKNPAAADRYAALFDNKPASWPNFPKADASVRRSLRT